MPRDASAAYEREELLKRRDLLRTGIRDCKAWLLQAEPHLEEMRATVATHEAARQVAEGEFKRVASEDVVDMAAFEKAETLAGEAADVTLDMKEKLARYERTAASRREVIAASEAEIAAIEGRLAEWGRLYILERKHGRKRQVSSG